jgi:hypothetical protein
MTSSASFFFNVPDMAPRTMCSCQPEAAQISSMVALPSVALSSLMRAVRSFQDRIFHRTQRTAAQAIPTMERPPVIERCSIISEQSKIGWRTA